MSPVLDDRVVNPGTGGAAVELLVGDPESVPSSCSDALALMFIR